MAHKQLLHELLEEDQEPFHLKSYISDRKSQLKKKPSPTTTLQLIKRKPIATKHTSILSKHACFLSFHNSPDVTKSPFRDLPSPVKSPNNAVLLHIPSRTAALLVEAAMRIQKQHKSQSKNLGFGLFGSFVKRLKERSKDKKRVTDNSDSKVEETVGISRSCSNRRLSSSDWTENNEDKSMDFEASSSYCGSECFGEVNDDFAVSDSRTFRFSLHRSPSLSGRCTPELYSPATLPSHYGEKNYVPRKSDNLQGGEGIEEEKEQCSPISILDSPFDEDDSRGSRDAEEGDYDLKFSYENVQRAKQQLLHRLRRFENLAELDPIELERELVEESDEEDNEPLSLYRKHSTVESFVTEVFDQSSLQYPDHMKKLVTDLIVEEKSEASTNDVIMGRICSRFDLWKEVEFNTIDMMVALDLKRRSDGWTRFNEQVEETVEEIERAVYALLVEELSDELFCCKCDI